MKKQMRIFIATALMAAVAFTSCKKTDTGTTGSDYTSELSSQSDDQARVSTESDAVADDANSVVDNYPSLSGRPGNVTSLVCDATVTIDSINNPRTVTITYSGTNCQGNRTRTGVVSLSINSSTPWGSPGAVMTANIQNLKITRLSDNKSITINGTYTYTNVSGGRLRELATYGTIIHTITSNGVSITFDNGTQRTWQVAKQRVFTYNNGEVITTTGTHTDGSVTNISEWGTNRFGNAFVTSITAPKVVRQDCDWRLVSGEVTHRRLVADVVVTFGLDAQGVAATCPGTGTYYYKSVWTGNNGIVRTVIAPY